MLAAAALAASMLAASFAAPAIAEAQAPKVPSYFKRGTVLARAQKWVDRHVPYSQTDWLNGYRTDCSGFVSMAWGLDQSYVTWTLPEVARRISKDDLLPGDIMLNTADHVVIFAGWANKQHTAYLDMEQASSTGGTVRRVVPYPFWTADAALYQPYRYTGGHNLYAPGSLSHMPAIQTYAGGAPLVPSTGAGFNAQRQRNMKVVAEKRAAAQAEADAKRKAQEAADANAKAQAATTAAEPSATATAPAATPFVTTTPTPIVNARADRTDASVGDKPIIVTLVQGLLGLFTR